MEDQETKLHARDELEEAIERAPTDEGAPTGTKAISRAAHILRLIARSEIEGIRLTHLATLTGIPHSTVRRVLKCLIDERFVLQDVDTRRYRLGPLNFELGLATLNKPEFLHPFRSVTSELATDCEDTIYFMVRSGADAVCLDRKTGTTPVRALTLEIGGRRPLGFGGAGLALLAQCPDDEIEMILEINRREIEVHKRLSRERILNGVKFAREHGYAITRDITTMGVVSVGAVLPMQSGSSPFAVSISFPREQANAEHIQASRELLFRQLEAFTFKFRWPFEVEAPVSD